MSRLAIIMLPVLLAGVLAGGWWSAARWHGAEEAVRRGTRQYEQAAADANEMGVLRGSRERVSLRERPAQDVIALVNQVLADVGVAGDHFKRLTAEADVALPRAAGQAGPVYRRQSVRLILQAMRVQELGVFLGRWRAAQPVWTPARIELARPQGRRTQEGHYDVTIILTAAYVAGGEPS